MVWLTKREQKEIISKLSRISFATSCPASGRNLFCIENEVMDIAGLIGGAEMMDAVIKQVLEYYHFLSVKDQHAAQI